MSNSITPTEKAQTMNLGGTMAFVQATLQRFNSEVIAPLIPPQASADNKLADKAFVNSSIATATATYRGNYNLVSDLELTVSATEQQIAAALATAISTADNNDYCYVAVPTADDTPTEIARIDRYKHNGTAWALEYTLNNSGFTAAEWAAIQSGITSGLVAKLTALPTLAELTLLLAAKQDEIIDLSALGNGIGTCATAASTTEKAVTLQGYELKKNGFVAVSFDYDVPASATMNINSKGAKAIVHKGAAIQADVIKAGDTAIFGYDGTNYVLVSSSSGDVSGTVTVSLVPVVSGSQYAASLLNGVTVELWNVSDNKTVETKTWAGSQLSFTKVMAAKTYKLKFSQKYGYSTPQDSQDFVLGVGETYAVGTVEYQADKYVLNVSTNQSDHTDLASTVIRVSATGISADGYLDFMGAQSDVEVFVPKGATVTAACQSGQPSAVSYLQTITVVAATNPEGDMPVAGSVTALYETEAVTVALSADDGSDVSAQQATVKDHSDSSVIGTVTSGQTLKIAFGTSYDITVADIQSYETPTFQTRTAAAATYTAELEWIYKPIITGYIILDQTTADPTKKVIDEGGHTYSGYQRPAVITAIRNASHRYVGTFANNKMTLKQLSDTNGTMYADGTSAAADIATQGKDVFMRLPFFFTRVSTYATNKIKIEFAFDPSQTATTTGSPNGSGWKQWGGNDLIGAYEAFAASATNDGTGGLYSRSGVASSASISQANFRTKARNRGTGFTLVKWRHQNLMAILFYAYYGHTNCQALCGTGSNAYTKNTGLKNSLGMADTTASNGNTDSINFWGLENWWGNKYEAVDNVVINTGTWVITEDNGTTRTPTGTVAAANAWVYPSKFIIGDHLDTIPATGETGGSDSQGYCDAQYIAASDSRVVFRSCGDAHTDGGVACVFASHDSAYSHAIRGSRLAFTGTIEIS